MFLDQALETRVPRSDHQTIPEERLVFAASALLILGKATCLTLGKHRVPDARGVNVQAASDARFERCY
jgi:hypothetical protein